MANLKGNIGEWSEIYIFLKLISERKLRTSDADYSVIEGSSIDVLKIVREEIKEKVYTYKTGEIVSIYLNDDKVKEVPVEEFILYKNILWKRINENKETTFTCEEVEEFLNSIFIYKLKAPSNRVSSFSGETVDIVVETRNRSDLVSRLGFSCKADLKHPPTLINASGDNTNFKYELVGDMDDDKMYTFNTIYDDKGNISAKNRMHYLKSLGIDLNFVSPVKETALENLTLCGGMEFPSVIGTILKYYYFINESSRVDMQKCMEYLVKCNVAKYKTNDLHSFYYYKLSNFLYSAFTGMKFGKPWNGKNEVNGGYIVVKKDGEVVAFHSTLTDQFKDFLMNKVFLDSPSHKRHKDFEVYKEEDKYYIKFSLQMRFKI